MVSAWIALQLCGALAKDAEVPVPLSPYRIQVWLDIDRHPQFPAALRQSLTQQFYASANRFFGKAWEIKVTEKPGPVSEIKLPDTNELQPLKEMFDKILWVKVAAGREPGSSRTAKLQLKAWEFDFRFNDWSGPSSEWAVLDPRLGDRIFNLAYRQFRPQLLVTGVDKQGKVKVQMRGLALQPASSARPLAPSGMPFRVFREYLEKDKVVALNEVPYTFLLYRQADRQRLTAECDLVSALRSALSRRTRGRSRMIALGSSQSMDATTKVQFVNAVDDRPVVGLEASLRPQDRGARVPIGTTDHRGQLQVRPVRLASELGLRQVGSRMFELRLNTGDAVIASLPLIPGETEDLEVTVRLDPLLTEISGLIVGLQDELLDAVVSRKVLTTQLQKAAGKGEAKQASEIAKRLNDHPNLAHFENKLKQIKEHAEKRRGELERPKLGSSILRLFVQTESLLKKFSGELLDLEIEVATE